MLELPEDLRDKALFGLIKIYYAIGGFSRNQGESERAYNFIVNKFYNSIECYSNNSKYYLAINLSNNYKDLKITKNFTWGNIEVRACVWGRWGVQNHHRLAQRNSRYYRLIKFFATCYEKTRTKANAKSLNGHKHGRKS